LLGFSQILFKSDIREQLLKEAKMEFSQPDRCVSLRSSSARFNQPKAGFNVIELLILTAVLGITLMLLMPALQYTRETTRRVNCINHLKELSLACVEHQATLRHYPSGGWPGPDYWMGDPDRGYGLKQPGGWTYNVLSFIENKALHDRGLAKTAAQKKIIFSQVAQTPLAVFYCPSRRPPLAYPIPQSMTWHSYNMNPVSFGARTDYAANGRLESGMGIIFARSVTTIKDIRDGLSHTCLLGEKNLLRDHYKDGLSKGDSLPLYGNSFWDWERSGDTPPEQDRRGYDNYTAFGSAHLLGFNMSFCDGNTRTIPYNIDPLMFKRLCNRNDGHVVNFPQ
jgi:Tfp pilus assembly protein FimT